MLFVASVSIIISKRFYQECDFREGNKRFYGQADSVSQTRNAVITSVEVLFCGFLLGARCVNSGNFIGQSYAHGFSRPRRLACIKRSYHKHTHTRYIKYHVICCIYIHTAIAECLGTNFIPFKYYILYYLQSYRFHIAALKNIFKNNYHTPMSHISFVAYNTILIHL